MKIRTYKPGGWADKLGFKDKVHIDKWDIWNTDIALAQIIHPILKMVKEASDGMPSNLDAADAPEHLQDDVDRWNWILDEMIFAFGSKLEDWHARFISGHIDVDFEDLGNGKCRLKRGPKDTFKIDIEGTRAYQDRISNGFRLFGKYYESLWT